eukprot:356625-Chlamydomonas_euryale.AAC.1
MHTRTSAFVPLLTTDSHNNNLQRAEANNPPVHTSQPAVHNSQLTICKPRRATRYLRLAKQICDSQPATDNLRQTPAQQWCVEIAEGPVEVMFLADTTRSMGGILSVSMGRWGAGFTSPAAQPPPACCISRVLMRWPPRYALLVRRYQAGRRGLLPNM